MFFGFLKVLLLLIMAIVTHIGFKAPNQASPAEMITKLNFPEKVFSTAISLGFMGLLRLTVWLVNTAEAIVILGSYLNSTRAAAIQTYFCPSLLPRRSIPAPTNEVQLALRISSSFLTATAALAFGGLVRLACYYALGNLFTFRIALRKNHKLITSGPYAYVRHPAYLGGSVLAFSFSPALFARGSYLAECWSLGWKSEILIEIIMIFIVIFPTFMRAVIEDELLKKEFGREWDEWAMRVRYRCIPGVW